MEYYRIPAAILLTVAVAANADNAAQYAIVASSPIDNAVVLKDDDGQMRVYCVGQKLAESNQVLEYIGDDRIVLLERGPDGPVRTIVSASGKAAVTVSPNLIQMTPPAQLKEATTSRD